MSESAAAMLWQAIGLYALVGAAAAIWLLAGGLGRFDRLAAAAPWRVKALWAPGLVLLWPVMLARAAGARPAEDGPQRQGETP